VEAFVQKEQVKLQDGIDGHTHHSDEIDQQHQVAEINKGLIL
jgi:hypothetical protein